MRTLELRLEDVGYHFEHEGWKVHIDGAPMPNDEAARKFAALEFFDRAAAGLLNTRSAEHAFKRAAEATLLRFGVRIVGLEAPEPGLEPPISPDPPQPTDPEPIATQRGSEAAKPATVVSKTLRGETTHYLIGPTRLTREAAEADLRAWQEVEP